MTTPVFPTLAGLGWPIIRTSRFLTNMQKAVSGKKTTVKLWTYPEYEWELTFNILRVDALYLEFQTMLGFFNQMAGQATVFLYQDQDDNQVTGQTIGIGDGVTTSFQLVRTVGGSVEPIFAPNIVSNVYESGGVVAPANYTVYPYGINTPGQVVFNTAPLKGTVISSDFSFYFPCNFTSDEMSFEKFMWNRYRTKKVGFVSKK